jgi:hypothetical protein
MLRFEPGRAHRFAPQHLGGCMMSELTIVFSRLRCADQSKRYERRVI